MAEPETPELARAAVDGGADIVELGFPFSDPLADGPVIRRAGERRARPRMRTRACLDVLRLNARACRRHTSRSDDLQSLLEAYGWERFAEDATAAGATSMIIADLPAGERTETRRIQLVAPTSTDERIALSPAPRRTAGFTSSRWPAQPEDLRRTLACTRRPCTAVPAPLVDVPLYAGFRHLDAPEHARAAAELADGIVVGSRAVQVAEDGPDALRQVRRVAPRRTSSPLTVLGGSKSEAAAAPGPKRLDQARPGRSGGGCLRADRRRRRSSGRRSGWRRSGRCTPFRGWADGSRARTAGGTGAATCAAEPARPGRGGGETRCRSGGPDGRSRRRRDEPAFKLELAQRHLRLEGAARGRDARRSSGRGSRRR